MAEKCTNTSSPVERWINPYPFAPLNHFTVPFSLTEKLLSPDHLRISSPNFPHRSPAMERPLEKPVKPGCVSCQRNMCRRNCPKAKDSSVQRRVKKMRRELPEPWTIGADFYRPAQDINLPYQLMPRLSPGHEHQIIRTIKSFRKKN